MGLPCSEPQLRLGVDTFYISVSGLGPDEVTPVVRRRLKATLVASGSGCRAKDIALWITS